MARGKRSKDANIELGLAILAHRTQWLIDNGFPDEVIAQFRTLEAMAYYCGTSREGMRLICEKALRKLRIQLMFYWHGTYQELQDALAELQRDRTVGIGKNGGGPKKKIAM